MGDPVLGDRGEDRRRVDPAQADMRAADRGDAPRCRSSRCSGTSAASRDRPSAGAEPERRARCRARSGRRRDGDRRRPWDCRWCRRCSCSAIASHSSAGGSPGERGIALGEQRLVVDVAQALAAVPPRIVDVDHERSGARACAAPPRSTGANSRSVISTLASPCSRMKAIEAASSRVVERVQHGAGHRHAVMRLEHRRHVRRQHRHRVAAADARPRRALASRRQRRSTSPQLSTCRP